MTAEMATLAHFRSGVVPQFVVIIGLFVATLISVSAVPIGHTAHLSRPVPPFMGQEPGSGGLAAEKAAQRNSVVVQQTRSAPVITRPAPDGVASTLVVGNGTVVDGRYTPPEPTQLSGAVYDPADGLVYVGDSQGSYIFGLNGTTGRVTQSILTGWSPAAFTLDPTDDSLLIATGSAVIQVNPSTGHMVKVIRGNAGAAGGSMGIVYDAHNGYAYVVDSYDGLVRIINVSAGTYMGNISLPGAPGTLAFDPVDNLLYVGNGNTVLDSSSIAVLDTTTNRVVVGKIGLGSANPNCMVFDPANGYIYVGNSASTNTTILDASTHSFVNSSLSTGNCISMLYDPVNDHVYVGSYAGRIADINGTSIAGPGVDDPNWPAGLAYDSRDNLVFAANSGDQTLTLFNASTGTVVSPHESISETLLRSTFDPLNSETYVASPDPGFLCAMPGSLFAISPGSRPHITSTIPVGFGPEASVVATRSNYVFVANACSDNVTMVNAANDSVIDSGIPVGSYPMALAYDPLHDEVWVANGYSNNLTVLNGSTGAIVNASVPLPVVHGYNNSSAFQYPDALAFDPTSDRLFVADYGTSNVTVLNASSRQVVAVGIGVGSGPEDLAYDPSDGTVIVANSGSSTLSVLNASNLSLVRNLRSVGIGPVALALDLPRNLVYVADAAGGTVAAMNLTTGTRYGSLIPVNGDPQGVSYDPVADVVDVADFASGAISVLGLVPVISSVNITPNEIEVGQTAEIAVVASEVGGAPLTYSYSGLPVACPSVNASILLCRASLAGAYTITVTVTDPSGYLARRTASLDVVPALSAAVLNVTRTLLELGDPLNLSVQLQGGILPWTFSYSGLPPGCTPANVSVINCVPDSTGTFSISVTARDMVGVTSTATATVQVDTPPSVTAFLAVPPEVTIGSPIELWMTIEGGIGPYSYAYSGLPTGCSSANATELPCTPKVAGSFNVTGLVTDSRGRTASAVALVIVSTIPIPPPPVLVSFAAVPSSITLGASTTFLTVTEGGVPPFVIDYSGLPPGCVSQPSLVLTCTPNDTGAFHVTVRVSDSLGRGFSPSVDLDVTPDVSPVDHNGSNGPVGSSGLAWYDMVGIGGVVGGAVGAVAAVVITGVKRRRNRPPPAQGT